MSPVCQFFYSHLKHLIGPRFNIPLIGQILLRNISDILKDNSVLRMVRDGASHLMPASFFPSQGHVCAIILDRQRAVRQQLLPLWQEPLRRRSPLASRVQTQVNLHPKGIFSAFTISKVYCVMSSCKRTNSHCKYF
jgi:hypothetical protein